MDIVSSVIENNKESFSNEKTWKFIWGDVSSMRIEDKYDLIMSRDVFFHLTFDKIMCAINNFSNSKSKYLIATSNPGSPNYNESHSWNVRLNEGGFRDVDLLAPPLSLPEPNYVLEEKESSRIMGIWKLPVKTFTNLYGVTIDCGTVMSV